MKASSALPRWIFSSLGILCLVFTCATISPVTLAQQPSTSPTQETAKTDTADLPPLPLSPIERAQKDGTALPLSLKEVTKLALQNNLDIAIQDTNEQLSQQKILQAYGDYDPTLTGTLSLNSSKSAITNYTNASTANYSQSDRATWNFTFNQPIKTGGRLSVQWNSSRSDSNNTFNTFNPQYTGSGTIQFTQPLLRNLRIDSTRSNIKLVNLDMKNTDSQFKQRVTDTISNIHTQYWSLVSAVRDYEIKRNSVRLAQISLRDNKKKVEVGTSAPIDVTDAEAVLAQREVDLISSEETIMSQENALRALISSDRNSEIWSQVIVPTDTPDFQEYKIEMSEAIETALKNRPELEQSDISLERLQINKRVAENNRKWQLDLSGSLGSNGVSGPQGWQTDPFTGQPKLDENGNKIPVTLPALIGGIGNAYKTVFTQGYTNWTVQLQLNIPLRSRSLDSQIAQLNIQRKQELMRRKQTEQTIQVDVRNAVQQLETRKKQVETAGAAKRFARERLDGEVKRAEAGLSQNYLVLQRQNELASAEFTELQALINYKRAVINLQKAMYTLLEFNDFEIAKGSSANVPDLK